MLNNTGCPKCGGEMDEGKLLSAGSWSYISGHSSAKFFSMPIMEDPKRARACLTCGYLELYINPEDLAKKIAGA